MPYDNSRPDEDIKERLERVAGAALRRAVGTESTPHAEMSRNLLREYLGAKYDGDDERQDRAESVVVDRTMFEVVENTLAQLMEMFHGQERAVEAEPAGDDPEDVALAEQQSEYANYVYNRDNEGYAVSYAVLKSALVTGEGAWRVAFEAKGRRQRRRYSSLPAIAVQKLIAEPGTAIESGAPDPSGDGMSDVVAVRTWVEQRIDVSAVPPEQLRWPTDAVSLDETPFVAREYRVMRADLVAMGFDREEVEDLPSSGANTDETSILRRGSWLSGESDDPSMDMIDIAECYVRADFDGDGIPEWWQVWLATGNQEPTCLGYDEVDDHPFVIASPRPMPFAISGMGQAEVVADIQRIRTQATRMMLDRLWRSTQGRLRVSPNSPAWEHLQAGSPLVPGLPGDFEPIDETADIADMAQAIEMMRAQGEARTGTGATVAGLNPNALRGNVSAAAVERVMSAAERQVLMIARTMAETGFKRVFRRIVQLSMRHQDQPRRMRLSGRVVEIDPRSWTEPLDLVVNVGLGTGDRSLRINGLVQILGAQREALAAGLPGVTPQEVHHTIRQLVRALQLPSQSGYWKSPAEIAPAQPAPPPDPTQDPQYQALVDAEQIKQQGASEREAMKQRAAMERELIKDDRERDSAEIDAVLRGMTLGQTVSPATLREVNDVPRALPQIEGVE